MYYKRHFPPGTEKTTLISQKVAAIKGRGRWDERTPSSIVPALLLGPAPTKCANPSGIIGASFINAACSWLCQKTQLTSRKHRTEGCQGFQLLIHTVHTPCVKSSFALPTTQRVWEREMGFQQNGLWLLPTGSNPRVSAEYLLVVSEKQLSEVKIKGCIHR